MVALEAQQVELRGRLDRANEPAPLLHPNMADLYRQKVTALADALAHEESRVGASEALRGLVEGITLTPDGGELRIELQGNLAEMLRAAEAQRTGKSLLVGGMLNDGARPPSDDDLVQIMMVAGARNRHYLQLWRLAA